VKLYCKYIRFLRPVDRAASRYNLCK